MPQESKKRILIVPSGGTIASTFSSENGVKLQGGIAQGLISKEIFERFETQILDVPQFSSENATLHDWRELLNSIDTYVNSSMKDNARFDGILILHGTDTLAYFAQLSVRVLSYLHTPVIITGSKRTPDSVGSDAFTNVKKSFDSFLSDHDSLVNVVFTTEDGETLLVPGQSITMPDVRGDYGIYPYVIKNDFCSEDYSKRSRMFLDGVEKTVLVIPDVIDFPFGSIDVKGNFSSVLVKAYHSGTAQSVDLSKNGLAGFIKALKEEGKRCYIAPIISDSPEYESTVNLRQYGIIQINDMPFEGAWSEIVL